MSGFLTREQSNYGGEPSLLYEFRRGQMGLLYASSDRDVESTMGTFRSCAISNGGLTMKGMAVTDQFEITAPDTIDLASWFAYSPPSDTVYVIVRRFHWGQSIPAIVYIGQIVSVTHQADDTISVKCQPTSITLKRGGLRLTWQRGCVHGLYDQNCQVDKEVYRVDTTVTALTAGVITVAASLNGGQYWPGGILQWQIAEGTFERRLIQGTTGLPHQLVPFGQMNGFTVGMAITLYPGCKRVSAWCDGFFNNMANFGGWHYMPNKSPYDGDTVF